MWEVLTKKILHGETKQLTDNSWYCSFVNPFLINCKFLPSRSAYVHKIRLIVSMEKIDKNENFRNVKTPIETLTPVL